MTRQLRAWPVLCPFCGAAPGVGCFNQWGHRVKYQHKARKRRAETVRPEPATAPANPRPWMVEPFGHLYGYLLTAVERAAADGHPVPCDPEGVPTVPESWLGGAA